MIAKRKQYTEEAYTHLKRCKELQLEELQSASNTRKRYIHICGTLGFDSLEILCSI